MANYKIKCEAIEVRGKSGICPGSSKCRKGETYILTALTPEPTGMCGRAFAATHPMAFGMRWSDKMECERADYVNVTCPALKCPLRATSRLPYNPLGKTCNHPRGKPRGILQSFR
jgi:hypothetical protein